MKEYKASGFELVRLSIYLLIGSASLTLILSFFVQNNVLLALVFALAVFICSFVVLADSRIKVLIEGDTIKELRGDRVVQEFSIERSLFRARTVNSSGSLGSDLRLLITDDSGQEYCIDCSIFGKRSYRLLLTDLGFSLDPEHQPQRLALSTLRARSNFYRG